jgi:hypothetical protein
LLPGAAQEIFPEMMAGGWFTVWVEPSQPLSPSLQPSVLLDSEMEQSGDEQGPHPHAAGVKYPETLLVEGQPLLGGK